MAPAERPDPQAQKQGLIKALDEHRINTIGELRRVERIFATLGSSDVTQPMTSACMYLRTSLMGGFANAWLALSVLRRPKGVYTKTLRQTAPGTIAGWS